MTKTTRHYQLLNRKTTTNVNLYCDEWQKIADPIVALPNICLSVFDSSFIFFYEREGRHCGSFSMSLPVVVEISKALKAKSKKNRFNDDWDNDFTHQEQKKEKQKFIRWKRREKQSYRDEELENENFDR